MSLLEALNNVLKFRFTSYTEISQAKFRLGRGLKKPHDYSEKRFEMKCLSYI